MFVPTVQRQPFDCGVAVISAFFGLAYADVYFVAAQVTHRNLREGLAVKDIERIAATFQHPLQRVHWRKIDLEDDSGILGINYTQGPGHWVALRRGTLFDPDKIAFYDAEEYLAANRARPGTLLVEK